MLSDAGTGRGLGEWRSRRMAYAVGLEGRGGKCRLPGGLLGEGGVRGGGGTEGYNRAKFTVFKRLPGRPSRCGCPFAIASGAPSLPWCLWGSLDVLRFDVVAR